RGELAGDQGDGRAAGDDRVAGGRGDCDAGRVRLERTGRGDAESRRDVYFSARGVRAEQVGTADVVPVCVANVYSGATFGGVGFDWICALRELLTSAYKVGSGGDFRRAGIGVACAFVPADYGDWENLRAAVGWRDRTDAVL